MFSIREIFGDRYSGLYDKHSSKLQKDLRKIKKDIGNLDATKQRLEEILEHLPTKEEVTKALNALSKIADATGKSPDIKNIQAIVEKIQTFVDAVETQLASTDLSEKPEELKEESEIAKHLRTLLDTIPDVAENQLRPHIRSEARTIFREIFGDRYSDLVIDDDYEISLYDLQGNKIPLMAASGGEDVCVNFALRVAVNTALQKYSVSGPPPGLLILDEPGAGLDEQRRRWLPEAITGLEIVKQVIVVTHMEELKGSTEHIISLTPQGKGRQPLVKVE